MTFQLNYIFGIIVLCMSLVYAQDSETPESPGICITPDGQAGVCVDIKECKSLYAILTNQDITDADKTFLRDRHCGFVNGTAAVCCDLETKRDTRSVSTVNNLLPKPEEGKCGRETSKHRLLGGQLAQLDEYPWMVRLQYKTEDNDFKYFCGGSLINDRYVMTAAHCVRNPGSFVLNGVRVGEYDTSKDHDCIGGECLPKVQDILVEETILHPEYNSRKHKNDIALLRLKEPVQLNEFIQPICLPFSEQFKTNTFDGKRLYTSGWGTAGGGTGTPINIKQNTQFVGVNNEKCNEIYSSHNIDVGQDQLCASPKNGIDDSCKSDSGAPLMTQDPKSNKGNWYAVGVLSFGSRCGQTDWPDVFVRVSEYLDWISQTVKA
uniref:CLIP domain-containing serine protease n=1 Tax=Nyssomyia neivai TaxID=330878 RepID=A0A1L8DQA5_9DIPT